MKKYRVTFSLYGVNKVFTIYTENYCSIMIKIYDYLPFLGTPKLLQ